MGRRGPRQAPASLKLLRGVRGDRINEGEPEAPAGTPECPTILNEDGRAEWARIVPRLAAMGVLKEVDGSALALYCEAYSRWAGAVRKIAERGMVTESQRGGDRVSPYVRIAEGAAAECKRLLSEFGGTPSSRSGLKVEGEQKDELAEFLTRRKG